MTSLSPFIFWSPFAKIFFERIYRCNIFCQSNYVSKFWYYYWSPEHLLIPFWCMRHGTFSNFTYNKPLQSEIQIACAVRVSLVSYFFSYTSIGHVFRTFATISLEDFMKKITALIHQLDAYLGYMQASK